MRDKPSNGVAENTVMQLRGAYRTLTSHIESCIQDTIHDDHPLVPWMVEHSTQFLSRYQIGPDGKTVHARLHGKAPPQEMVPLGEKVLARLGSATPSTRAPRYEYGIW